MNTTHPANPSDCEQNKKTVLLIDDNEDVRTVIKLSLDMLGYVVVDCANGRDAIEQFPVVQPDVVIVDQGLPDIQGIEVGRQLRAMETGRNFGLMLLTGTDGQSIRDAAVSAGFDDFLVKPVRMTSLTECIEQHIKQ